MSLQSVLLLALIASGAIFVYFVCQLRKEGRELRETLTQALNCYQSAIVENARLKYEALGRSVQLAEEIKGNERRNAKLDRIKVEIWGTKTIDRNIDDAIAWIREAREIANYHADYSARLREHYAELEEKYNALSTDKAWEGALLKTVERISRDDLLQACQVLKSEMANQPSATGKPTGSTPGHLVAYLDSLTITSENIGEIRSRLFVPFEHEWNGIVRDETAARENGGRPSTVIEAAFSA